MNVEKQRENIGVVVGTSTATEFYFAARPGSAHVQDIVAVDINVGDKTKRVWAKVLEVERLNPLFPREAGQELANTMVNVLDTVLSISKEFITARCEVLGIEGENGELVPLTFPIQPASEVYRPLPEDFSNIISGQLKEHQKIEIGTLRSREDVEIFVNGAPIVSRHLAILAMTGAGKSYACRTILESLAEKGYPMLILDKHGDYVGLRDLFNERVKIFVPKIEFLEEAEEDLVFVVDGLSESPLTESMIDPFIRIFKLLKDPSTMVKVKRKFERYLRKDVYLTPNLWGIAGFIDALLEIKQLEEKDEALEDLRKVVPNSILTAHTSTLRGIRWRCWRAANRLKRMSEINKKIAENLKLEHEETPTDPREIIKLGQISIIFLSGYEDTISSTFAGHLLRKLFDVRVNNEIEKFLIVIEEAHTFAPSPSEIIESAPSLGVIKTIITEGRKFGVGIILISQRPSRLNSTILSQCNSFIILRIVNPADQKFVRDVVETIGEEEAKILPDLSTGEALLSGQFVNFPVMVKIKTPRSKEMRLERDFIEEIYDKWKGSSK